MIDTITSLLKRLQADSDNKELEGKKDTEESYDLELFKSFYNKPFFYEDIEKRIQSKTEDFLFLKNSESFQ